MDYPIQTPQQLRPLLVGFRKAAGLTQAQLAARLGVTQQTYAQLEAKPESASLDRLHLILTLLNVSLVLTQAPAPAGVERPSAKRGENAENSPATKRQAAAKRDVKQGKPRDTDTHTKQAADRADLPAKSRSNEPRPIAPIIKKRENW